MSETIHARPSRSGEESAVIVSGFAAACIELLDRYTAQAGLLPIATNLRVGFAFPGPFDYSAGVALLRNLGKYESLYGINIREALRSEFIRLARHGQRYAAQLAQAEIRFANDALLFGLGIGRRYPRERLLCLTLGTGLGSAFVENGRPAAGPCVPPDGYLYPQPYRGRTADEQFGRQGILRLAREFGVDPGGDLKHFAENAYTGDLRAAAVFSEYGHRLSEFLAPHIASFRPHRLILGGQISKSADLFNAPLQEPMQRVSGLLETSDRALTSTFQGIEALFEDSEDSLPSADKKRASPDRVHKERTMTVNATLQNHPQPLPKRTWTVCVIHHSHTDIGYTERQEKIERFQIDFIRQALGILEKTKEGGQSDDEKFRWTCETFWAVERFLEQASPEEREQFAQAVRGGQIELSGTYLNMTELPDYPLLRHIHSRAVAYAASIGHTVDSAMTADINGYGWGYARSLLENGIKHLFSCVHTHHGMFPLGRKQTPLWWEASSGERLLVWNGEHYMFGNELGLCPGALGKYVIRDEFDHASIDERHDEIARVRMLRYLCKLEEEGYPYDFVPVMLSGLGTDNAPPNERIPGFIRSWNEQYGETIRIEMTGLHDFFERLKREDTSGLPVHRGDWPDWWSDGTASTAMHTQIFRDAQRVLRQAEHLDPDRVVLAKTEIDKILQPLILYAEHTWGYHSSISEPWHPNVQLLEVRKLANAAEASRLAYGALDKVLAAQGAASLSPERMLRYRVINTAPVASRQLAALQLDGWEPALLAGGFDIVHEQTGRKLDWQQTHPQLMNVDIALEAGEDALLHIVPRPPKNEAAGITTSNTRLIGSDRISDMEDLYPDSAPPFPISIHEQGIESPFCRIEWKQGQGIVSWRNLPTGEERLKAGSPHGAFTPVYEVTSVENPRNAREVWTSRSQMGRNRKGPDVHRSAGRLIRVKTLENGPLQATLELQYEVEGMSSYHLFLKVYATINRVDVAVRLHKDSVWMSENVYIALPFTGGSAAPDRLYADKAGEWIRPWKDQLPGTCLDYTCVQNGLAWVGEASDSLLISMPDTPLVQLGPLEYGRRLVHTQQPAEAQPLPYSWPLTNYWETNFKATLGGFYEFRYSVAAGESADTAGLAHELQALNDGFIVTRMK
ncbi:ROK family protein [Saccharibacillus qingshengii]|uniref:ROK family protein n=1 Tax=Saccharibacillus qingshengii TaxID=1763540 RepID=UPI0031B59E60